MKNKKFLLFLLLLINPFVYLNLSFAGSSSWTFMVFMNGDNLLERSALLDFIEMSSVKKLDDITILVQLSRGNNLNFTSDCGNWTGTNRFKIKYRKYPFIENALEITDNSLNTNTNSALTEFIEWSMNYSITDYYGLIFWDHGNIFKRSLNFPNNEKNINELYATINNDITDHNLNLNEQINNINSSYTSEISTIRRIYNREVKKLDSESLKSRFETSISQNNNLYEQLMDSLYNIHTTKNKVILKSLENAFYLRKKADSLYSQQECVNKWLQELKREKITKDSIITSFESYRFYENEDDIHNIIDAQTKFVPMRKKLDFIFFDSCRVGFIEIADAVSHLSDIVVASQVNVHSNGLNYTKFLEKVNSTFNKSPDNIVKNILSEYRKEYKNHLKFRTLSHIDTRKISDFNTLLSQWVELYPSVHSNDESILKEVRSKVSVPDETDNKSIDIFDFFKRMKEKLKKDLPEHEIYKLTRKIYDLQSEIVKDQKTNKARNVNGISIYFPEKGAGNNYNFGNIKFVEKTLWKEIIYLHEQLN